MTINRVSAPVLRFSNTAWNAGQGPLHLVAKNDRARKKTQVFQRIYAAQTATGPYDERHVGTFEYHPGHSHFHFGDFAAYQLYLAAEWDAWDRAGRQGTEPGLRGRGNKTTFCIVDYVRLAGGLPQTYSTCNPNVQGMSVGWGDTYQYTLADQWVVLDDPAHVQDGRLKDGTYVLRSVADPRNQLFESDNKGDVAREGALDNEATTRFSVGGGQIQILGGTP